MSTSVWLFQPWFLFLSYVVAVLHGAKLQVQRTFAAQAATGNCCWCVTSAAERCDSLTVWQMREAVFTLTVCCKVACWLALLHNSKGCGFHSLSVLSYHASLRVSVGFPPGATLSPHHQKQAGQVKLISLHLASKFLCNDNKSIFIWLCLKSVVFLLLFGTLFHSLCFWQNAYSSVKTGSIKLSHTLEGEPVEFCTVTT